MLFDQNAPKEDHFTPLQEATGGTRRSLSLLGYRPDGSQNDWGKLMSWLPIGIPANALAKSTAQGGGLKQVSENIGDDAENRRTKLMAQLGIISGVASIATGNPAGVAQGIGSIGKSVGSIASLKEGINRSDDGMSSYY